MSDYETTIRAILSIPFVKELKRENKHLRKELKALKNLIYSLPEFRRDNNVSTRQTQVKIKKEPGQDDDIDRPKAQKENIVYVIDDTVILQAVQAGDEEAEEEEEEEEEVEEEEEGAEIAREEADGARVERGVVGGRPAPKEAVAAPAAAR